MTKIKINHPKREEDYVGELEERLNNSPLVFIPKEELEKYEIDIAHAGYEPCLVNVFGDKIGVVMKQELRGALMDPSENDLETLTSAWNYYTNYTLKKYGEKAKIPSETSLGRFIEDSKINSLIMNIFKFPTDDINTKKLHEYGLDRKEVLDLANEAYRVYCQTGDSLSINGGMECLESVGETKKYSGNSDSIDLSADVCAAGSHYKLNFKLENLQKKVQKELPLLSEEYISLEKKAVGIMMKHAPSLTEQNATNIFRMCLNLWGVYGKGKALPIR